MVTQVGHVPYQLKRLDEPNAMGLFSALYLLSIESHWPKTVRELRVGHVADQSKRLSEPNTMRLSPVPYLLSIESHWQKTVCELG